MSTEIDRYIIRRVRIDRRPPFPEMKDYLHSPELTADSWRDSVATAHQFDTEEAAQSLAAKWQFDMPDARLEIVHIRISFKEIGSRDVPMRTRPKVE
jgi:hypothetical protein